MRDAPRMAMPAYALALLLVLVPAMDLSMQLWPLDPGQPSWRFGAVGMVSRGVLTPMLGLFLALATATFAGHVRTGRTLSVLSGLLALAVLGLVAVFALDGLQIRSMVTSETQRRFEATSLVALMKLGMVSVILLAYAFFGWRAARDSAAKDRRAAGPGIVTSSDTTRRPARNAAAPRSDLPVAPGG